MDPVELLQKIATCWCEALAASPGGAPATCCMVTNDPVIPLCCEGFGWVRMIGMQPVYPGGAGKGAPTRCNHPTWKMIVELGISRCAPKVCGNGAENPCCENEAAAVNVQFGDFNAFARALGCCLLVRGQDPYDSIASDQVRINGWSMDEPLGGCVTGRGTAAIDFAMYCDCE